MLILKGNRSSRLDLEGAEGEGFICLDFMEGIAEFLVDSTDEGEEEGVQVSSSKVSGGNWGDGKKVEDETVRHIWILKLMCDGS